MSDQFNSAPGDALEQAELLSCLDKLVNNLSEAERKVIIMRYFQGRELKQLSDQMHIHLTEETREIETWVIAPPERE